MQTFLKTCTFVNVFLCFSYVSMTGRWIHWSACLMYMCWNQKTFSVILLQSNYNFHFLNSWFFVFFCCGIPALFTSDVLFSLVELCVFLRIFICEMDAFCCYNLIVCSNFGILCVGVTVSCCRPQRGLSCFRRSGCWMFLYVCWWWWWWWNPNAFSSSGVYVNRMNIQFVDYGLCKFPLWWELSR